MALAEQYARESGAILLLKGPATIISDGERTCLVDTGCPGMATAGSGDVLSGILAAVCAYSEDLYTAVAAAAYINGRAGEAAQEKNGEYGMVSGDTAACIPGIIKKLQDKER